MKHDIKIPWVELMAFGLGRLNLSSKQFWAMTLIELDASIDGHFGSHGLSKKPERSSFEELMQAYPDRKKHNQ